MREVNPTKPAPLLLISIMTLAVFSGVCIAITFNSNSVRGIAVYSGNPKIIKIPSVSATDVPLFSADPISDPKPN